MKIKDVVDVIKSGISQLIAANYYDAETPELTATDVTALAELGKSFDNINNICNFHIFYNSFLNISTPS